jgi:hypothetical protein
MRSRRHKLQVSTFPFLAVLLCAMGALLLVLLVMDRRAHAAALDRAEQALRRTIDETTRETESRRAALDAARKEAHDRREQKRAAEHARLENQIGEVNAEIQAVRDQMAKAAERLLAEQDEESALKQKIDAEHAQAKEEEQALIQVRAAEATKAAQSESSRQVVTRMTADLARLEQALADLKEAREKEKNTYSVVPYNGKRGESRRPLYVECAAGEVIFHPDHLSVSDSREPSEVQAEVERRLLRQKQQLPSAQAAAFTPYLMLLVRPDGVLSYYHLRESLRGLKIEFGYEFIDKEWVLDFPADDAASAAQSWVTTTKPTETAPASAPAATHVAGVPTPGQDGSPPPHANSGSSGPAGSPAPFPSPGAAVSTAPRGVLPAKPGGDLGFGPSMGKGEPSSFGSSGGGSPGPGGVPALFPSAGVAMNSAPRGVPPGKPGGDAGNGSGIATGQPSAIGPMGGSSSGSAEPPGHLPAAPPLPAGTVAGAGGSSGGYPGAAPAVAPIAGAAHSAADPSKVLPELGPPRANAGQKTGSAGTTTPADSDPTNAPSPSSGMVSKTATGGNDQSSGSTNAAAPASKTATADGGGDGQGDDDPFLRATPTPKLPKASRPPPALRPARLSGNRDWIVFVECKTEGIVVYPTHLLIPASALGRASGSNPLLQSVQQLIDRKQATVRPGDAPYRPEVRFLVHPDAGRTYHLAYPTLDALAAPKTAQTLAPEDDVAALVAAH